MAAIHFLRPDLSNAVIDFICQKYRVLTPVIISEGIARAYDLLQDLSADLLLRADNLPSLPWRDYYEGALGFIEGVVYCSALVERAFIDAGHAELGHWAGIGVYCGALAVVYVVLAVIRCLLGIVRDVIAGLFCIVFTVLAWVLSPLGFVLGIIYRLFSRRNGRPLAPGSEVHESGHWCRY